MSDVADEKPTEGADPSDMMFSQQPKLHIPEEAIPGYKLYWFRGDPGRLHQAKQMGFEHVEIGEIDYAGFGLSDDRTTGSTGLGNFISVAAQEGAVNGQFLQLFLMKVKREIWNKGMEKYVDRRLAPVADAFRSGMVGSKESGELATDTQMRYTRKTGEIPEMFKRKAPQLS